MPTQFRTHPAVGLMARRQVSYQSVAEETGYCRHWVSQVLRGLHPASATFRKAISDALGVPEDELFDQDDA